MSQMIVHVLYNLCIQALRHHPIVVIALMIKVYVDYQYLYQIHIIKMNNVFQEKKLFFYVIFENNLTHIRNSHQDVRG